MRYLHVLLLVVGLLLLIPQGQAFASTQKQQTYMGFTPWPYDLTEEAVDGTYDFILKNGNIVAHHLDNGIPWQEALDNKTYPKHLAQDWNNRRERTPDTHRIFLSITPIGFDRSSLSPYWGEQGDNQPLPAAWKGKRFNDPQVKQAFLNYALAAIGFFNPDYLAIGIESNILITKTPDKWRDYLELNAYVYTELKKKYPDLPVFVTVQYEHMRGIEDESKPNQHLQKPGVKKLMQHSDYLGLSTYRYGNLHPNPPKADYFKEALAFGKPIAVAETGAMSKTTLVMGIPLLSNPKSQSNFIAMIMDNAQTHNFVFVINWVGIDFDAMIPKLPKEARGIAKAWVHTGMLDKKKKKKKAFKIWRHYLSEFQKQSQE